MIKTFNVTMGLLTAFSVWCAAIVMSVVMGHVLLIGGLTVYRLLHS